MLRHALAIALLPTSLAAGQADLDRVAIESLVAALGSDDYLDREEAQRALVDLGPAVGPILDALAVPADPEIAGRLDLVRDAIARARAGGHADAIARLEAILAARPEHHGARRDLAWTLLHNLGDSEAAEPHLRRLVDGTARKSLRASALHGLAEIARRRGDLDGAIALHERGIALRPTHGGCLALAWIHDLDKGDVDRAIELCRQSLEIRSTFDFGRLALAVLLAEKGDREEAAAIVEATYRAPTARHLNLARYHAIVGERQEALAYLESYFAGYLDTAGATAQARRDLAADRHLASLADEPAFRALLGP